MAYAKNSPFNDVKKRVLDNHCIELLDNHLILNGLIFSIVLLVMMRPLRE